MFVSFHVSCVTCHMSIFFYIKNLIFFSSLSPFPFGEGSDRVGIMWVGVYVVGSAVISSSSSSSVSVEEGSSQTCVGVSP